MLRNFKIRQAPALKVASFHPPPSRSLTTLPHQPRRGPIRRQNFLHSSGIGLVGLLGTMLYVYPSTPPSIPAPHSSDPLSALSPHDSASTEHLRSLGIVDLLRLYVVYLASSQDFLVRNGPALLRDLLWTRDEVPFVGALVWAAFEQVMKRTVYRVFVGGASVSECAAVVDSLAGHGIGCMLNYSAEASPDGLATSTQGVLAGHFAEAHTAIRAASAYPSPHLSNSYQSSLSPVMLSMKLTGVLADPQVLARATAALLASSAHERGSSLPSDIVIPSSPNLSDEDYVTLESLIGSLRSLCTEAKAGGVRLLFDAEQVCVQPAIDRIVEVLSEEFNKPDPDSHQSLPIVYNTYQAYLRVTPSNLALAIARADVRGYAFGAKLVRGAYLDSERLAFNGTPGSSESPVWSTKAETDASYDACALALERRIAREVEDAHPGAPKTAVLFASHNRTSVLKILKSIKGHDLVRERKGTLEVDERLRGRITFAQLFGMSDGLTTTLATTLHPSALTSTPLIPLVVKAVPYATFEQAIPYLLRRASENHSILQDGDPGSGRGGAPAERRAVGRELRRRMGFSLG